MSFWFCLKALLRPAWPGEGAAHTSRDASALGATFSQRGGGARLRQTSQGSGSCAVQETQVKQRAPRSGSTSNARLQGRPPHSHFLGFS